MSKNESKTKNKARLASLSSLSENKGLVCGPNGCSLADHYDWAKKDKTSNKKKD